MKWPSSQEYNEAIQNPASSFADPDLRKGSVALNAMGLPVPRSGNFADVYQFTGGDGRMWAVKCFTRKVDGLSERYARIDEHLTKARLRFTVGFKFLEEGIRVQGQWFPLLKMEWVEGFALNEFVRDNAGKPHYLHSLLQLWVKLASKLRGRNFAHADLQHGNVLLVPGDTQNKLSMKLIDYDGMWVPALAGKHSGELGHPNYQHPLRLKERLYNAAVDRFPHLVIASALRAVLIGGRAIWDQFDNGDNLLFRESDLRDPARAPVFQALWNLHDDALCALLGSLALASREPLQQTPWLDDLLLAKPGPSLTAQQEKRVIEMLGVAPHFTARTPVARPAVQLEEFGHFEFDEDPADEPLVERPIRPKSKSRPADQKMVLFYAVAACLVLVCIAAGLIALNGGKSGPTDKDDPSNAADEGHPKFGKKSKAAAHPPAKGKSLSIDDPAASLSGRTFVLSYNNTGKVIAPSGKEPGAGVQQFARDNSQESQRWVVSRSGKGFKFKNRGTGMFLAIAESEFGNQGANARQLPEEGNRGEVFELIKKNEGYAIYVMGNGMSLGVAEENPRDGTRLLQWRHGGNEPLFTFIEVRK